MPTGRKPFCTWPCRRVVSFSSLCHTPFFWCISRGVPPLCRWRRSAIMAKASPPAQPPTLPSMEPWACDRDVGMRGNFEVLESWRAGNVAMTCACSPRCSAAHSNKFCCKLHTNAALHLVANSGRVFQFRDCFVSRLPFRMLGRTAGRSLLRTNSRLFGVLHKLSWRPLTQRSNSPLKISAGRAVDFVCPWPGASSNMRCPAWPVSTRQQQTTAGGKPRPPRRRGSRMRQSVFLEALIFA
ncbi:hypothetical protein B0T16DRAFT_3453 [Cercophora newfieldiana]|uniref:Uncharacterized protein n=1 Tax=Cercophora newfieldiana TaxID=92897 RepID=A0AA39YMB5_9PEZI|nr:hypothetical protein B0T16DRAFT_3453 [Cercophora newfieldiana]